jgi:hypothetical protein
MPLLQCDGTGSIDGLVRSALWADLCEEMGCEDVPQLTCIKLPCSFTVIREPMAGEEAVHLTEEGAEPIEEAEEA